MSGYSWAQQLVNIGADGNALTNSLAQTSLLTGSASPAVYTLQPNTLGLYSQLLIKAAGKISTLVTGPGTLTFTVKIGSVNACVSQALTLNTVAQTNAWWGLELLLTARTIGSGTSCALLATGDWRSRAVVASGAAGAAGIGVLPWVETAPAVGTGFDSTVGQAVDLQATWSVQSASNSIACQQYGLFLLN